MTHEEIIALPSRRFAEKSHHSLGRSNSFGADPSSHAIGGYYSMAWYEAFEDPETKERYRVYCKDGVYGGRGPFKEEDM